MTNEEMISRIEAALGPDLTGLKLDWREACAYWGPSSPGALGILLALVREALEDEDAIPMKRYGLTESGGWVMYGADEIPLDDEWGPEDLAPTMAEALVCALEVATRPSPSSSARCPSTSSTTSETR